MTDINDLARTFYDNSREKGFYAYEDELRSRLADERATGAGTFFETTVQEHYGNRLMLIVREASEAHEEIRDGHPVHHVYYSQNNVPTAYPSHLDDDGRTVLNKPEGLLAELADVAVRTLETIAGILANLTPEEQAQLRSQLPTAAGLFHQPVIVEEILHLKHAFNLSRAKKHGGKAF